MPGGSGAVRAGKAYVELSADDQISKVLDQVSARIGGFAKKVALIGAGVGVGAGIAKFFTGFVDRGSDIQRLSQQFGSTAEKISQLQAGFEAADVSMEEFDGILGGLNAKIKGAADSNSELIEGLRGLRGRQLIGKDLDEQLDTIAEKFKSITLASDQFAVASELGMTKLLPFLKQGKAGIDQLRQMGRDTGGVINTDEARRAQAASQEWNKTLLTLRNSLQSLISGLLPGEEAIRETGATIRKVVIDFRDWIKSTIEASETLQNMSTIFNQTWTGIMQAVKKGEMELAWNIAYAGIKAGWFSMLDDMAQAFADFIKANHERLVVLGSVMLGIKGASLGKTFGPWGLAIGGVAGAVGGGLGADYLASELEKSVGTGVFADRAKRARDELSRLTSKARTAAGPGGGGGGGKDLRDASLFGISLGYLMDRQRDAAQKMAGAVASGGTDLFQKVKGGFNASSAQQQFGYGDTMGKRQLAVQQKIEQGVTVGIPKAVEALGDNLSRIFSFK